MTGGEREDARVRAAGIAVHLGLGWLSAPDEDDWHCRVSHEDGRAFSVNTSHATKGKLVIYPLFPRRPSQDGLGAGEYGPWASTSIKVSASRTDEVIAREITRRFLPGYDADYLKVLGEKARDEEDAAMQDRVAEELLSILGGKVWWKGSTACINAEGLDVEVRLRGGVRLVADFKSGEDAVRAVRLLRGL